MVRGLVWLMAMLLVAVNIGGVAAAVAPVNAEQSACCPSSHCGDPGAMALASCERCCLATLPRLPAVASRGGLAPMVRATPVVPMVSRPSMPDPPPPRTA